MSFYTDALETRLRWHKWSRTEGRHMYEHIPGSSENTALSIRGYEHSLREGPTYFMNRRFCELVDYARRSIPDDLKFEMEWMLTKSGWMWLETPFDVPKLQIPAKDHEYVVDADGKPYDKDPDFKISAISWYPIEQDTIIRGYGGSNLVSPGDGPSIHFLVYLDRTLMDRRLEGFGMWSYFVVKPGEPVINRIRTFECIAGQHTEGAYTAERTTDVLHEIRWIYTAMHLMSEKLAVTREEKPERALRRRWEREKVPIEPLLRVVTLRRFEEKLEEARKTGQSQPVDWQWQWIVRGFWREQWYPSLQQHKTIWVEDFLKGPVDKPLKPPSTTIYKAAR